MAISTVHQWPHLRAGIGELVRVARGPIVILTSDPAALQRYWLADYLPEILEIAANRFPLVSTVASLLGGAGTRDVPIPLAYTDGFEEPSVLYLPGASSRLKRTPGSWTTSRRTSNPECGIGRTATFARNPHTTERFASSFALDARRSMVRLTDGDGITPVPGERGTARLVARWRSPMTLPPVSLVNPRWRGSCDFKFQTAIDEPAIATGLVRIRDA